MPTAKEIEAAKTPAGAWTRATLAGWGVSWPPKKGWKARLLAGQKPDENDGMRDRIAALEARLKDIGDFAHDRSTGPTVPDDLWEVRRMAYDL